MRDIKITDDKTIKEVQEAFHEHFPYLKLEFYAEAHVAGQGSVDALKINISSTIGEARTKESEGNVNIHGN